MISLKLTGMRFAGRSGGEAGPRLAFGSSGNSSWQASCRQALSAAFIQPGSPMKDDHSQTGLPAADSGRNAVFSQTHWTTVLQAQGSSPSALEALNRLCCRYWPPVYAFIRRQWKQHSPHKAEDLTQGFFSEFTRKFPNLDISPSKGKFRTYLLS